MSELLSGGYGGSTSAYGIKRNSIVPVTKEKYPEAVRTGQVVPKGLYPEIDKYCDVFNGNLLYSETTERLGEGSWFDATSKIVYTLDQDGQKVTDSLGNSYPLPTIVDFSKDYNVIDLGNGNVYICDRNNTTLLTSDYGKTWSISTNGRANCVYFHNGTWITAWVDHNCYMTLKTSTNGVDWSTKIDRYRIPGIMSGGQAAAALSIDYREKHDDFIIVARWYIYNADSNLHIFKVNPTDYNLTQLYSSMSFSSFGDSVGYYASHLIVIGDFFVFSGGTWTTTRYYVCKFSQDGSIPEDFYLKIIDVDKDSPKLAILPNTPTSLVCCYSPRITSYASVYTRKVNIDGTVEVIGNTMLRTGVGLVKAIDGKFYSQYHSEITLVDMSINTINFGPSLL